LFGYCLFLFLPVVQTGTDDIRYAQPDDIVGWKWPGYTLPAHKKRFQATERYQIEKS
jgi:hypothetical protein